jgi:hypothetical protein
VGNPVAEKDIFAAFLAPAPDFAGEAVQNWCRPQRGVLCSTGSNEEVGLELTGACQVTSAHTLLTRFGSAGIIQRNCSVQFLLESAR